MDDGLARFVRARLDEDEREARRVPPNQSPTELRAMVTRESGEPFLVVASERVLREVDTKRRMLDEHPVALGWDGHVVGGQVCRTCAEIDSSGELGGDPYPCKTLRLLALPYADHPDYREEWRP